MRLLSFIVALITTFAVFGINCTDSVNVRFRIGHRYYDPSLGNNREAMDSFVGKVREAAHAGNLERIVVHGYASPDGKPKANERLAQNRCATIANYIITHTGVNPDIVERRPSGIGWSELRHLVDITPDVPSREKVLEILDNTPLWVYDAHGNIVDSRKKQLMDLAGGRPWRWMYVNIFPDLRNAVAITLYCRPAPTPETAAESTAAESAESPEIESSDIEAIEIETEVNPTESANTLSYAPDSSAADSFDTSSVSTPFHRLALKTNMLYYALLLPNIELEWLINEHWSVAVEGNLAWWGSYNRQRSYRLALFDAEGRYWFKTRAPWHGMYAGVIAGGGYYDIEKDTPGYYGSGLMTGISFGYMWPVTRCLSLEAELGVGYVYTRYKEYEPFEGHHVYLRTKDLNYFGPIKAKFSLVWRLFDRNKTKKTHQAL